MAEKVAVVGAGVGGLATAARLARYGFDVEVCEKLSECGGRNHLLQDRGFKFDMGPSFVMMPDLFREFFSYCQVRIQDYLNLTVLDPSYKIFFSGGEELCVYQDTEKTKAELERFEKGASAALEAYISETQRLYHLIHPLLYECFTRKALLNPAYWKLAADIKIFDSYWKLAKKFFKSEALLFAMTFEAMFMGVTPFDAPAFYSIISYADHAQKIYHPIGGMYEIPLALEKLGRKYSVDFQYNKEVKKIVKQGPEFILETTRGQVRASHVVVNADYAYAQKTLLKRKIPDYQYSCSVYLLYLGLKRKISSQLAHHNLFFSGDPMRNLNQIFREGRIPDDPSFYAHVPTVTDPSLAPLNKDLVYLLIPVPNSKILKENFSEYEYRLRQTVFSKIRNICGINLDELIEVEHKFVPQDFVDHYNIEAQATFGLAHNLWQSAFFRPANFDGRHKGLYYVGASTQPGGGLPPVLAGSRIVADMIRSK